MKCYPLHHCPALTKYQIALYCSRSSNLQYSCVLQNSSTATIRIISETLISEFNLHPHCFIFPTLKCLQTTPPVFLNQLCTSLTPRLRACSYRDIYCLGVNTPPDSHWGVKQTVFSRCKNRPGVNKA